MFKQRASTLNQSIEEKNIQNFYSQIVYHTHVDAHVLTKSIKGFFEIQFLSHRSHFRIV